MKSKKFQILVVAAIASIMALALTACGSNSVTAPATAVADSTAASATADAESLLGDREVYLYDSANGIAMTRSDAADIAWESELSGHSMSMFSTMVTDGVRTTDSSSGITFVTEDNGVQISSNGANVYVLDGVGLSKILGGMDGDDFVKAGEVETSYGKLHIYQLA